MADNGAPSRREALLTGVLEAAGEGIVLLDAEGTIAYVNPVAKSLFGLPPDVVGRDLTALGTPVIETRVADAIAAKTCDLAPVSFTREGRVLACRLWCANGPTEGIAIAVHDDTEMALHRERVAAVLHATDDGLAVLTPAGIVTYANPAAVRILGVPEEELVGSIPDFESLITVGLDELDEEDYTDLQLEREEGPLFVKARVQPVSAPDGHHIGHVLVLHDITAEYEIAQMKNEFVSTVSHELRTPLTSIKGYVDLILDGSAGEVSEVQRDFLSIVKENSDRLVELINDMLDISRIESGRIHLKIEPLSIADAVAGAVNTFQAVLNRTGHAIEVDAPGDLQPVAGDRDRIGQVLINLISNAIKYSPEGGTVHITAREDDDRVIVAIRDEGLGISAENQKRLFTKFYRVDSAYTREIGGTGLGLSICKSIVELLGGEIWCESTQGEGSTFAFSLPAAPPSLVRTPLFEGPEGAGGTVLVIDRDEEIAALIETYLAKQGYDVIKAFTAEEALHKAIAEKPDAITLDVILEDADGFELIQSFKEHPETADIPVLVLSIVCDEGRSCRFGAADYLEKPIDQERLVDVIGDLVGSKSSPLVLVADDDVSLVGMLTETLKRRGFSVAAAYDGEEALAAIEQRRPDVVLLDLKMPRLDGYGVIKAVKTHPEWGDVPIVVMTAHPIDRARTDILNLTAGRFHKPLSPTDIVAEVEMLLTGRTAGGEPEPATESAATEGAS